jgi:CBS domain-containing membrane protein
MSDEPQGTALMAKSGQSNTGDLPAQLEGLAKRLRLKSLESRHNNRFILGVYVLINSGISIGLLSALAAITDEPFVFPSLGPTAFLVFFLAMNVQSAPKNVFFGHLIGVIAGYAALVVFGLTMVPPDLEHVTPARVGAAAMSLSLTLAFMIWLNVPHAPAGATTLIVGLGLMRTPVELAILMAAVVLMILQAIIINRLAGLPYPLWLPVKPK